MRSIKTIISSNFGKSNARKSASLIVRTNADQFAWQAPFYALWRAAMHALGLSAHGMHGDLCPVTTGVTTPVTGGTGCERSQRRPGRRMQSRRRVG